MIRPPALVAERRAAVAVIVAGALPMLMGLAALAIDLGVVQLERRRLQGVADAAALAAAHDIAGANAAAARLAAANPGHYPVATEAAIGHYDRNEASFSPGAADPDAVRVTVRTDVPTVFAAIFGTHAVTVERRATARRIDMAGIAIGSRLASLDGGVANALLGGLTGGSVGLSVMDYRALASAQVDLVPWLKRLGADARISAVTHDEVLSAELPASTVLGSLANGVADPVAQAALRSLSAAARGTIRLADLIQLGELGGQGSGGGGLVRVAALDLASNIIQGSTSQRQVAIDLGAQVPGIARTRLWVAIGERPNRSPWIALTRDRTPVVRTAQVRAYLEAKLNAQPLPGISLASVEIPLFVELASGEARLEALNCAAPHSVDVGGRPSPGQVALARIDPETLGDFTRAMPQSDARLLEVLLLRVEGRATIDLGAAEPFQTRRFDAAAIAAGTPQKVSSGRLTGGIAASLMQSASLRVRPLPLDPVVQAVGGQLSAAAPLLDPLLMSVTKLLGVGVGEADLWVTGLRCGQPVLVE